MRLPSKNDTAVVGVWPTGTAPNPGVKSATVGERLEGTPLCRRKAGVLPLSGETKLDCVAKPVVAEVGVAESYSGRYKTAPPPRTTQLCFAFQAKPTRGPKLSTSHWFAYVLASIPENVMMPGVPETGLMAVGSNPF